MHTDFQKKVWCLCEKIPRGKITTYKIMAVALNKPNASRAVGNALNKNPYAPAVPCHRVIKTNGCVGGFSQGKKKKILLLKKEGLELVGDKIYEFEKHLFLFS